MPGCNVTREVVGTTAHYALQGKFEGSCAWDLCSRLQGESLRDVVVDFSQVSDFVDYGVAVVANAIHELREKQVRLRGLRQHQVRLFHYFGIDLTEPLRDARAAVAGAILGTPSRATEAA